MTVCGTGQPKPEKGRLSGCVERPTMVAPLVRAEHVASDPRLGAIGSRVPERRGIFQRRTSVVDQNHGRSPSTLEHLFFGSKVSVKPLCFRQK